MSDKTRLRTGLAWVSAVAVLAAVTVPALGLAEALRSDHDRVAVAQAARTVPAPPVRLTPQGTGASPVSWRVRQAGDPAVDDVLRAYQRYLGTTVRLAEAPDLEDPALPRIATGARLAELQRFLVAAISAGGVSRGPVTATATVLDTGPTQVTLLGCTDYSGQRTTTSAGATPGTRVAATVLLVREDGTWKVASSTRTAVSRCR